MTAVDPTDPIHAAEAAAQDWTRHYVGKRRANEDGTPMRLDEQTMADLVAARVALWLGDREGHDTAEQAALLNLYRQGHTWASAHAAIRAAERDIDSAARVQLDLLLLDQAQTIGDMWAYCPDPATHARLERGAAQERRLPARVGPNCCAWCGKPVL